MLVLKKLTVAIDFHSMEKNNMEVNSYINYHILQNSSFVFNRRKKLKKEGLSYSFNM